MVSEQSQPLIEHYRRSNRLAAMDPPLSLAEARDKDEHWGDVTAEPGGVDYLEVDADGVPAMWAVPHGSVEGVALLCLHGGGYIGGSMYSHRKMYGHLAKAAGVRALIPHYRRTPEFRHPAPVDDCTTAYRWLLERGYSRIAVTGDSAGGGMTISIMLRAREWGLPLAAALMPLSPWVDVRLIAESITTRRGTDVLFGGATPMNIDALVEVLLGPDGDRTDPLVSPLFADLTGFPPVYIQVGGAEMLLDDARGLEELARKAGVEVRLDEFPDQQHTFQMSAGRAPEADDAIGRLAAWARPRLGL